MKFKIKKEDEEKKEPEIELWLEKANDGIIYLIASDGTNTEVLMTFKDGMFYRYKAKELKGLETDACGKIKEEG